MSQRIAALELALQQISDAKKQLYRNTTEAKSRIQCNMSRQLEALRNREVWLLNQLDIISGAKEEVLQQQSARLHKTLGILQSSRNLEEDEQQFTRLDLEDIQPEETPHVSFKADSAALREAIMNYGKIDSNSIPNIQSPYTAPDQPAPSLPRHFEDYNDAEHHVLYKTLEEVSRNKTEKPCVYVNIPKLSNRIEDWLLLPKAPKTTATEPRFNFPKLSNNLADWLKSPISICKTTPASQVTPLDGISADASIKTWLHKIKQNPYEEDEDDFEFIEEMSDAKTEASEDLFDQTPALRYGTDQDRWLYKREKTTEQSKQSDAKVDELPLEKWLLKTSSQATQTEAQAVASMSSLLTKITEDELDKWLLTHPPRKHETDENNSWVNFNPQAKPAVPSSLHLPLVTGADNPWLLQRSTSSRSSSPASSRSSLGASSNRSCRYNKWLLNGGQTEIGHTSHIPCPIMDSYKKNIANTVWLKSAGPSPPSQNVNPLANFSGYKTDISAWLKPTSITDFARNSDYFDKSPLKTFFDHSNSVPASYWLAESDEDAVDMSEKTLLNTLLNEENLKWLHTCSSASSLPTFDEDLTEEDL